jgi:hypothetical protein
MLNTGKEASNYTQDLIKKYAIELRAYLLNGHACGRKPFNLITDLLEEELGYNRKGSTIFLHGYVTAELNKRFAPLSETRRNTCVAVDSSPWQEKRG